MAISTGERSLLHADASHLAMLRLGLALIALGFVADILWLVCIPLLMNAVGTRWLPTAGGAWSLVLVIDAAGSLLSLAGWWLVTTRNPAWPEEAGGSKRRRAMRWLVGFLAILTLAGLVAEFVPLLKATPLGALAGNLSFGPATVFTPLLIAVLALRGLGMLAKLARFILGFFLLAELAAQIPDAALAKRARRALLRFTLWSTLGWTILIGPLIGVYLYLALLVTLRSRLRTKPVSPVPST